MKTHTEIVKEKLKGCGKERTRDLFVKITCDKKDLCPTCKATLSGMQTAIKYDLEFIRKFHKSKETKDNETLKQILHNLSWFDIMRRAIEHRKTSWSENPIFEWRNATDEVCMAVLNALEDKGVLDKIYKDVLILERITDCKNALKLIEEKTK